MHLETKKLLWDVLESAQAISRYTDGKGASDSPSIGCSATASLFIRSWCALA